jgi:hypothetical protein
MGFNMRIKKGFTVLLFVSSALLTLSMIFPATTALAEGGGDGKAILDFNAFPPHASSVNPSIKSYFWDKAKAGSTISESLVIRNSSKSALTIHLMTVSSENGLNGGISYATTPSYTWISGLPEQVTIPAKGSTKLPFKIRVPYDTKAGDYLFAISMTDHPPTKLTSSDSSTIPIQLNEQVRQVVAVLVTVPGPSVIHLDVNQASIIAEPSGAYLDVKGMSNSNVLIRNVSGKLVLYRNGQSIWSQTLNHLTFLPRSVFNLEYRWVNEHLETGHYIVDIDLNGDQIGHLHKQLTFDVSISKLRQIQQLTGQKTVQTIIPSWVYIAGGILLILLLLMLGLLIITFRKLQGPQRKIRGKNRDRNEEL